MVVYTFGDGISAQDICDESMVCTHVIKQTMIELLYVLVVEFVR